MMQALRAQRTSLVFPGGAHAPAAARAAVGSLSDGAGPHVREAVLLLVSELVTNSVRHGRARNGEPVKLDIDLESDSLRVAVSDHGPGFVPAPRRDATTGGWGLVIVDELADRWGVTRDGRTVWFECDLGS
jgi:two-component sensor histidine kinase